LEKPAWISSWMRSAVIYLHTHARPRGVGSATTSFQQFRTSQSYETDARTSVLLKRLAYSPAVTPSTRRKVRRIASADLKPQEPAISLSPREELSMICCAA